MTAIDGIASGIDTSSLINSLVNAASVPRVAMQSQLGTLESRLEGLSGLQNRLQTLSDLLGDLADIDGLNPFAVTSASDSQFTVSADATAPLGTFNVQVENLARNAVELSQGFADKSTTGVIGEGTVTVTYGGVATDVTIDSSNSSLQGLADALNQVDGVSAYVLDTGTGASPYKLVVSGQDTGAANTITVDTSALAGGTAPTFAQQAAATDAKVLIDGIEVYSASNRVTTAIPGVTLDLTAAGTEPVRVDVARNPDGIRDSLNKFVDAYNDVVTFYDTQTVFNPDLGLRGGLTGDASARRVMSDLGLMVSSQYPVGEVFSTLAELGVATQRDGKLELDAEAFDAAVAADADGVTALLTSADGPFARLQARIDDLYVDGDNGILESRKDSVESSIDTMQDRIEKFDDRMSRYAARLRERFNAMELVFARMQSTQTQLAAVLPSVGLISGGSQ